jgi:gluconate 5-dehydrogenase
MDPMIELFGLSGKTAILTGGAGGIGRALALGMARCGADILVADLQPGSFSETADEIRALGRQVTVLRVDVTEERPVSDMVDSALEEFHHIDILVNAAGIAIRKPADSFPIDEWQKVMDINVRGTFLTCQAVGRVMIKQGSGKIINISSVRGRFGAPKDYAGYCTSKGAVDALTRTLACEWGKYNVLVNAIAPGTVETDLVRPMLAKPEDAERLKARIPVGHWAMPEDLVGPVVFLASKASDFITGQVIYIDGGMTAGT